ncbi:hypothetical protein [Kitasatospora purpeofusca]|uniref:Uncharacterized protein n=1 Tax=Kitasatospora purpeofusca TaxID=67352 RepID=A0ABZ1TX81_9ACTN|nr:hypothetical protein [Kitasatospora purpeofusca]
MTRYSVDPDRGELIATWGTGEGDLSTRIAALPATAGSSALLALARALALLSDAAWRTYTHPAGAAGSLEPNTEGWRREEERKHFAEVVDAITKPHLPSGGAVMVSYSHLLESANRVGRALHHLDAPDLTAAVLAEASGYEPTQVVLEADNIESLPHETPTLALGLIDDGATPHQAVTGLVRHATHITDGLLPDPTALREQLDDLEETVAEYTGEVEPDLADIALRLTPLDPKRPARDLLEDLLTGIHACWLLHSEYDEDDTEGLGTADEAEDWDDEQAEQHQHASRERFAQLVRETAAHHRDRLI